MFGLFKKRAPEVHLRQGKEVGECREIAAIALKRLGQLDPEFGMVHHQETAQLSFHYHQIPLSAAIIGNTSGLQLETTLPELNIQKAATIAEKAFAYRCIDHVSWKVPGVRGFFHPNTGDLVLGVKCAGFEEQFRADTLIDIALFMIEDAVSQARTYLGLPAAPAEQVRVDQWDGGYHFGEGIRTFSNARDAFAAYMVKHEGCVESGQEGDSVLLQSGPVQYELRGFGWPNGFMIQTATRGLKHVYADDKRYVEVWERLAQDILNPERPSEPGRNYWGQFSSTILYFQPDGTLVLAQYGFGNPRTDANRKAFGAIAAAHMLDVYYMTYLAEELPEELYSDERNRPN
ncbi:hypothetical protein [Deinococcus enclensis]|uniref:Uncharacterized protein n=1 Tax=Deinococcus enclensis TaxID=1049582 RepID=A0ABT9MHM2_9DEIO|nr:hypothetical protein [Deinococcus enclensis]MDP9765969.1 hypothetical protein [Deinococcus enclensis]